MIKSLTVGICALAFTTSLAFAQTGQEPTTTSGMSTQHSAMDANAKMMKKKKMKKSSMMKSGDGMKSDGMKSDGSMMKKDGMSK